MEVRQTTRNGMNEVMGGDDVCRPVYEPVYEPDEQDVLGQRLVVTPWMLLDHLKDCQDEAERLLAEVCAKDIGLERRYGVLVNPLAERLERLHFGVSQLLRLLWRGGLWVEGEVPEMSAADGRTYHVVREPFTDGKPNGRPLPEGAPNWQRELLGLNARAEATAASLTALRTSPAGATAPHKGVQAQAPAATAHRNGSNPGAHAVAYHSVV